MFASLSQRCRAASVRLTALSLILSATAQAPPALAAARDHAHRRLAALPVDGVNLDAAMRRALGASLVRALSETRGVELTWGPPVYRAIARAGCGHECPGRVADQLEKKVDSVVMLRAARLGQTHVLRLTLFDTHRDARLGSWQEVLSTVEPSAVRPALRRMIAGFVPTPAPVVRSRPWYTRWWVWTLVGAVVAGAVATGVVLGTQGGPTDVVPAFLGRGAGIGPP